MKQLLFIFISFSLALKATSQTTVYTTKTGKKYHRDSCRYLLRSKIKTTIQRAKNFGYTACSVCKPVKKNANGKIEIKSTNKVVVKKDTIYTKEKIATLCSAITKSGVRCERKTEHKSGKCHQLREGSL